jgi:hypothetical protein
MLAALPTMLDLQHSRLRCWEFKKFNILMFIKAPLNAGFFVVGNSLLLINMIQFLRLKNTAVNIIFAIATTITAGILALYGFLYKGSMDDSLARFLTIINLLAFAFFFSNFCINLFGKERIIRIKSNRQAAIVYFIAQLLLIFLLHFPLLLWVLGVSS